MGWLLNLLALVVFAVISIIDQIVRLITKRSGKSAYSNGLKINVFGNELFADTLNLFLLKKGVNEFGVFGEPISSVLGRTRQNKQLNYFGHFIRLLVDAFDYKMWLKNKSHCKKWIRTQKDIDQYIKNL